MKELIETLSVLRLKCNTSNQRTAFNELVKSFGVNKEFEFNFEFDKIDDILDLTNGLYNTTKFDSVYWYGYEFKPWVDSVTRTKFIKYIRGLAEREFNEKDKRIFVENPLIKLSKQASIQDIDFVIYPDSKRSDLNQFQGKLVTRYFKAKPIIITLVKNNLENIKFDYEKYRLDNSNKFLTEKLWLKAKESIDTMMDKIRSLDYFHLANQKPKYRNYFYDYLVFNNDDIDLTKYNKGIILDDISTTGATLDNIISICKLANPNLELFIYSIIGKQ